MTSDGVNSYTWNARNQLSAMDFGAYSFQYDGLGRRAGKTAFGTTVNYLYDGPNIVQELAGGSPTVNLLEGGVDENFLRTDSSGSSNFLRDALGSTLALTDSSGSSLVQYAYEPFGNTVVTSGSSTNEIQYAGRENDGTGLFFNRARYYNPAFQRFVSEDPIGWRGGTNSYAYAHNAPIRWTDPTGYYPGDMTTCDLLAYIFDFAQIGILPIEALNPLIGIGIGTAASVIGGSCIEVKNPTLWNTTCNITTLAVAGVGMALTARAALAGGDELGSYVTYTAATEAFVKSTTAVTLFGAVGDAICIPYNESLGD